VISVIYKGIKPAIATPGSAGHDLQSVESVSLVPGEQRLIRTGLRTAMPVGVVALVFIRSGCAKRGLRLMNHVAVIDSDYRGEWMLMIHNSSSEVFVISEGDRLAQAVFIPYLTPNFIEGNPDETERGAGGFGSTGKS
jgi:dUTP pyrophosphatase